MFDRSSFVRRIFNKSFLFVFLFVVSGCGPLFPPTPIPDGTQCLNLNPDSNPYTYVLTQTSNQPSDASNIYQYSFKSLENARQMASVQLRDNTGHLSDWVDVATNDTNMVRIEVTYLDPELVQYIVLNHFLNAPDRVNSPKPIDEFNKELTDTLQKLAARNEILFLVTVTSPFYKAQAYNSDVLIVNLPINEMVLVNGSGRRINPSHTDYVLSVNIEITRGFVSGVVAYPTATYIHGECIPSTDQWTTSLALEIPNVKLGGNDLHTKYWYIPFRALVMRDDTNPVPNFDPTFITPISKLEAPPTPSWIPNAIKDDTKWELYWDEMGRYIWNYVISESHR